MIIRRFFRSRKIARPHEGTRNSPLGGDGSADVYDEFRHGTSGVSPTKTSHADGTADWSRDRTQSGRFLETGKYPEGKDGRQISIISPGHVYARINQQGGEVLIELKGEQKMLTREAASLPLILIVCESIP